MRSCTKGCVRVLPRQSPLGLCRPTLSLHIQDGPAGPGESACIQFGSYSWRASLSELPLGCFSALTHCYRRSDLRVTCTIKYPSHSIHVALGSCPVTHSGYNNSMTRPPLPQNCLAAELTWLVHPVAQRPVQRGATGHNPWVLQCSWHHQPSACPAPWLQTHSCHELGGVRLTRPSLSWLQSLGINSSGNLLLW